jgi:hypothetical protein
MEMHIEYVDHERDCAVTAVALEDYNGDVIVTGFIQGHAFVELDAGNDWNYELLQATDSGVQAQAALLYHLGEVSEEHYLAFADSALDHAALDEMSQWCDGHELVALVGRIATAAHLSFPDVTPAPRGL